MTILLIEDNRLFSEMLELSLTEAEIYVVESLAAAKEWLECFRADLILVDLGLPDSHGLETLRALGTIRCPKVVITAARECPLAAAKLGAVDFVNKGSLDDMLTRIRFQMNRLTKRPRFSEAIFNQIRAYIEVPRARELAGA
jgi:DNA-binding response OmpR family regulator